jgi:hypothetical protein
MFPGTIVVGLTLAFASMAAQAQEQPIETVQFLRAWIGGKSLS